MSRQIQIRRGTATEHDAFIGAMGELTMDITNNTVRVHDGQTPGGVQLARADDVTGAGVPDNADYVIATQLPTAENNYTWYRKYKSGWVEQGGYISGTGPAIMVKLIIKMSDINYGIAITGRLTSNTAGSTASVSEHAGPITATHFYVNNYIENGSTRGIGTGFWWYVSGIGEPMK